MRPLIMMDPKLSDLVKSIILVRVSMNLAYHTNNFYCAAGRNRTDTGLSPQVFETCVSTNFTTAAIDKCYFTTRV